MTRKDYELIAGVIRQLHQEGTVSITDAEVVAEQFAASLTNSNPRFDRARFLKACGVN